MSYRGKVNSSPGGFEGGWVGLELGGWKVGGGQRNVQQLWKDADETFGEGHRAS